MPSSDIGDLTVRIKVQADTKGVEASLKGIESAFKALEGKANGIATAFDKVSKNIEKSVKGVQTEVTTLGNSFSGLSSKLEGSLTDVTGKVNKLGTSFDGVGAKLDAAFDGVATKLKTSFDGVTTEIDRLGDKAGEAATKLDRIGSVGLQAGQRGASGLKQMETALDRIAAKADMVGQGLQRAGSAMMIGGAGLSAAAVPGVIFTKDALKTTTDFYGAMANVQATTGMTGDELLRVTNTAKDLGAKTMFSSKQAADGFYYLASAGMSVDQQVSTLPNVLNLAASTQYDLAASSEFVANTMSQYGIAAEDSGRITNVYAAAIAKSQATMEKLIYSMRYAGPVANSVGVSFEETVATLGKLYDKGYQGEQAGTALRNMMLNLVAPTKKQKDVLEAYGLSAEQVNPKVVGLTGAIHALKDANIDEKGVMGLFGKEATSQALSLIAEGGDSVANLREQITGTDYATQMMNTQMSSMWGIMQNLDSAIESIKISLGESLKPTLEDFVTFFNDHVATFQDLATRVGTAVANGLKPIIDFIKQVILSFEQMDNGSKQKLADLIAKAGMIATLGGPLAIVGGILLSTTGSMISGSVAALKFAASLISVQKAAEAVAVSQGVASVLGSGGTFSVPKLLYQMDMDKQISKGGMYEIPLLLKTIQSESGAAGSALAMSLGGAATIGAIGIGAAAIVAYAHDIGDIRENVTELVNDFTGIGTGIAAAISGDKNGLKMAGQSMGQLVVDGFKSVVDVGIHLPEIGVALAGDIAEVGKGIAAGLADSAYEWGKDLSFDAKVKPVFMEHQGALPTWADPNVTIQKKIELIPILGDAYKAGEEWITSKAEKEVQEANNKLTAETMWRKFQDSAKTAYEKSGQKTKVFADQSQNLAYQTMAKWQESFNKSGLSYQEWLDRLTLSGQFDKLTADAQNFASTFGKTLDEALSGIENKDYVPLQFKDGTIYYTYQSGVLKPIQDDPIMVNANLENLDPVWQKVKQDYDAVKAYVENNKINVNADVPNLNQNAAYGDKQPSFSQSEVTNKPDLTNGLQYVGKSGGTPVGPLYPTTQSPGAVDDAYRQWLSARGKSESDAARYKAIYEKELAEKNKNAPGSSVSNPSYTEIDDEEPLSVEVSNPQALQTKLVDPTTLTRAPTAEELAAWNNRFTSGAATTTLGGTSSEDEGSTSTTTKKSSTSTTPKKSDEEKIAEKAEDGELAYLKALKSYYKSLDSETDRWTKKVSSGKATGIDYQEHNNKLEKILGEFSSKVGNGIDGINKKYGTSFSTDPNTAEARAKYEAAMNGLSTGMTETGDAAVSTTGKLSQATSGFQTAGSSITSSVQGTATGLTNVTASFKSLQDSATTLKTQLGEGKISQNQYIEGMKELSRQYDVICRNTKTLSGAEKEAAENWQRRTENLINHYNAGLEPLDSFITKLEELADTWLGAGDVLSTTCDKISDKVENLDKTNKYTPDSSTTGGQFLDSMAKQSALTKGGDTGYGADFYKSAITEWVTERAFQDIKTYQGQGFTPEMIEDALKGSVLADLLTYDGYGQHLASSGGQRNQDAWKRAGSLGPDGARYMLLAEEMVKNYSEKGYIEGVTSGRITSEREFKSASGDSGYGQNLRINLVDSGVSNNQSQALSQVAGWQEKLNTLYTQNSVTSRDVNDVWTLLNKQQGQNAQLTQQSSQQLKYMLTGMQENNKLQQLLQAAQGKTNLSTKDLNAINDQASKVNYYLGRSGVDASGKLSGVPPILQGVAQAFLEAANAVKKSASSISGMGPVFTKTTTEDSSSSQSTKTPYGPKRSTSTPSSSLGLVVTPTSSLYDQVSQDIALKRQIRSTNQLTDSNYDLTGSVNTVNTGTCIFSNSLDTQTRTLGSVNGACTLVNGTMGQVPGGMTTASNAVDGFVDNTLNSLSRLNAASYVSGSSGLNGGRAASACVFGGGGSNPMYVSGGLNGMGSAQEWIQDSTNSIANKRATQAAEQQYVSNQARLYQATTRTDQASCSLTGSLNDQTTAALKSASATCIFGNQAGSTSIDMGISADSLGSTVRKTTEDNIQCYFSMSKNADRFRDTVFTTTNQLDPLYEKMIGRSMVMAQQTTANYNTIATNAISMSQTAGVSSQFASQSAITAAQQAQAATESANGARAAMDSILSMGGGGGSSCLFGGGSSGIGDISSLISSSARSVYNQQTNVRINNVRTGSLQKSLTFLSGIRDTRSAIMAGRR